MTQRQRTFKFYGVTMSDTGVVDFTISFNRGPEQRIQLDTNNVIHDIEKIFCDPRVTNDYTELLYEQNLSMGTTGYIPVAVTVHTGTVCFAHVKANYVLHYERPWDNPRDYFSDLFANKEDPKKHIKLDGELQQTTDESSMLYHILPGQQFECDILLNPAQTTIVPLALYYRIINKVNLRSNT